MPGWPDLLGKLEMTHFPLEFVSSLSLLPAGILLLALVFQPARIMLFAR